MIIPFGEWLPDLPPLGNAGALEALNVIPRDGSYRPFPGFESISSPLNSRCRGATSASDKNGANYTYGGDAAKLYRLVDTAMTDASKPGGYSLSAPALWEFASWGETVIAASIDAPLQTITLGGTQFADLVTSTRKPKANHIAVVREFVVLGNVTDSVDGAVPHRVWWSAAGDASNFDPNAATESDFQDLVGGGGAVMKVVGGEYGVIVQRRAISRMSYEGPPTIFRFDQVESNRGAIAAGAVANVGQSVFYIADDGIYRFEGAASVPIGRNKVDAAFFADLDQAHLDQVSAAVDPVNALVLWAYPGAGNVGGTPNRLLLHNWATGAFARAEVETEFLFRALAGGYSLDGLDSISTNLDALTASLDSSLWQGGTLQLGGFTPAHRLGYFTGAPLDAVIETAEQQFFPASRSFVRSVMPLVDSASAVSVEVGIRDTQGSAPVWGDPAAVGPLGRADVRAAARYHRFRVTVSGGFAHALGIDAIARPEGAR